MIYIFISISILILIVGILLIPRVLCIAGAHNWVKLIATDKLGIRCNYCGGLGITKTLIRTLQDGWGETYPQYRKEHCNHCGGSGYSERPVTHVSGHQCSRCLIKK